VKNPSDPDERAPLSAEGPSELDAFSRYDTADLFGSFGPLSMRSGARVRVRLGAPRRSSPPPEIEIVSHDEIAPIVAQRAAAAADVATDWIEVLLQDVDGEPIGGRAYVIRLEDGSTREGKVAADGRLRLEGIPAGTCRVSFPEAQPA
jgi:hypothetical protein